LHDTYATKKFLYYFLTSKSSDVYLRVDIRLTITKLCYKLVDLNILISLADCCRQLGFEKSVLNACREIFQIVAKWYSVVLI
jgi:hypothetical protein